MVSYENFNTPSEQSKAATDNTSTLVPQLNDWNIPPSMRGLDNQYVSTSPKNEVGLTHLHVTDPYQHDDIYRQPATNAFANLPEGGNDASGTISMDTGALHGTAMPDSAPNPELAENSAGNASGLASMGGDAASKAVSPQMMVMTADGGEGAATSDPAIGADFLNSGAQSGPTDIPDPNTFGSLANPNFPAGSSFTVFPPDSSQAQSGLYGSVTIPTSSDTSFTSYITHNSDGTYSFADQMGDQVTVTPGSDGQSASMVIDGDTYTYNSANNSMTMTSQDGDTETDYLSNSGVAATQTADGTAYYYQSPNTPVDTVSRNSDGSTNIQLDQPDTTNATYPDINISPSGQLTLSSPGLQYNADGTTVTGTTDSDGSQTATWGLASNPTLVVATDPDGNIYIAQNPGSGDTPVVSTISPDNQLTITGQGPTDQIFTPPVVSPLMPPADTTPPAATPEAPVDSTPPPTAPVDTTPAPVDPPTLPVDTTPTPVAPPALPVDTTPEPITTNDPTIPISTTDPIDDLGGGDVGDGGGGHGGGDDGFPEPEEDDVAD